MFQGRRPRQAGIENAGTATQSIARDGRFIEPDQRDFGRPVLSEKIFRFRRQANHLYKLAPLHCLNVRSDDTAGQLT